MGWLQEGSVTVDPRGLSKILTVDLVRTWFVRDFRLPTKPNHAYDTGCIVKPVAQGKEMLEPLKGMPCPVGTILLKELAEATEGYFAAVNTLCNVAGVDNKRPSFSEAYERARQEHKKCKGVRTAMEQHRSKRHCH